MDQKKKILLNQAYQEFVEIGLNIRPILDELKHLIDPNIMGFGTTEDERIFSRQDFIDLIKRQEDQAAGIKLEHQIKPVHQRVLSGENSAVYVDDLIMRITTDSGQFEMKMRFSTVLDYLEEKWVVVHWHGSKPEEVKSEEDTWGIAIWKKKTEELERLVAEKTADLVKKNRELEIESALERVRAMTMAMHSSADIGGCILKMFEELTGLGVDERTRFGIGILNHENENNQLWTARKYGDQVKMHIGTIEMSWHPLLKRAREAWLEQIPYHHYVLEGEDLLNYYRMLNTAPDYKITIPLETLPKREIQHCFIFEHGFFYAFSPEEFDPEIIRIAQRFCSQFEQTYRRYLDLQKAETQAREGEIELALERVRARTMAMQESNELAEVSSLLFRQMKELGVSTFGSGFTIWDEDQDKLISWVCNADGSLNPPFYLPMTEEPWHREQYESWKKGEDFIVKDLAGEDWQAYFQYLRTFPLLDKAFAISEAAGHPAPIRQVHHAANFSHGNLLFITLEPKPEAHELFKRFAKVFEQTYTRFLDLKKAEAQAREAQIEAALERVRARAMAMHSSKELEEVALELRVQMGKLGQEDLEVCAIHLYEEDEDYFESWGAVRAPGMEEKLFQGMAKFPKSGIKIVEEMMAHYYAGDKDYVLVNDGEKGQEWLLAMKKYSPQAYVMLSKKIESTPPEEIIAYWSISDFKGGALVMVTYTKPDETSLNLLRRAANVFQLAYRRYLDLQKAEDQAREAQIEAALEKVRSRSLAMHKSEEFPEVIQVVFEQFRQLNFNIDSAQFDLSFRDTDDFNLWTAVPGRLYPVLLHIPYRNNAVFNSIKNAKKAGLNFISDQFSKEEKNDFFELFFLHYPEVPEERKRFIFSSPGFSRSAVLLSDVLLGIQNYSGIPFTDSENEILKRFAKVFEQTYTRFLDLQKAEAQAREAQIEAALEKVRSRSLAMHKSDELTEVVSVLFEKLKELQVPFTAVGIAVGIEGSKDMNAFVCGENEDGLVITNYRLPYFNNPVPKDLNRALEQQLEFFEGNYSKKDKDDFYHYIIDNTAEFKFLPEDVKLMIFDSQAYSISMVAVKNAVFNINDFEGKSLKESDIDIIKRFARVFDQAYTRFLDLKKAEAQAREAQIETALERVRSRTMAMQSSDELSEAATEMFSQIRGLGLNPWSCGFNIFNEDKTVISQWVSTGDGRPIEPFDTPTTEGIFRRIIEDSEKKEVLRIEKMEGKKLEDTYKYMASLPTLDKIFEELDAAGIALPKSQVDHAAYFKHGYLMFITFDEVPEFHSIFKRFAKVFEQTYTRFLDLQKAEEQAREAQIEAALERVRSRTMGMQKASELGDVAQLLFGELNTLVDDLWTCGFVLCEKDRKEDEWWLSLDNGLIQPFSLPNIGDFAHESLYEGWVMGETYRTVTLENEQLQAHYDWLMDIPIAKQIFHDMEASGIPRPNWQRLHAAYFKTGYLVIITEVPCDGDEIFKRFAQVFDQTYTRFLDLQRAEAQAREAEIQLALERVRARSMAMQSSDELHDVLSVLFRQFDHLGIHPMNVYLSLFDRENRTLTYRASGKSRHRQPQKQVVNVDSMAELKAIYDKFINDQSNSVEVIFYSREILPQVFEIFSETFDALPEDERMKMEYFPEGGYSMAGYTPFGYLGYDHHRPANEEEKEILSRFCHEFTRVYQRFLDIQKAEAQAREAQIEAALERVRSRTLAMQKSDELAETAAILFQQLIQLGIEPNRLYIGIIQDNSSETEFWTTEEDGSKISTAYTTDLLNNPSFKKMYEGWKRKEKSTVVDIQGEELREYIDYLTSLNIPFKDGKKQTRRIQYLAYFAKGFIGMASPDEQPQESMEILERFAYAFNLTFTRFNDLKVAEAQARQAQIEVALERVRARALAMQEPEELKEVATVLRQEMGALGVEELETSSIYIHDPGSDLSECWYAIKDIRKGKTKLVSDHFALNLPETWVGQQMLKFFESSQTTTSIVMTGNNRVEWIRFCEKNSKPLQGYYGQEIPDRTYHLYKFSHGAIGAASAGDISKESWDLLKRAATAFSLAYSRFKDLTQARIDLIRLKEAKQKAEEALAELKSAQSQLIQAEKMASLGELTAGIAHEIQNPLNFVNNFSEVSGELIDEAQEEIEKGDLEEIKFILQDLKDNLSKINHHGKRAGSIVKGMLEHSRKSEGKKELTDLNQLADECLRLSFHGLRAKDKTFSADFKTDFDPDLPKLEVVSQDMGRVLLNLINNAFYAVNEKAKGNIEGYKPEVIVSTKKTNSGIEISVSDNGAGIPDSIKEKIFQPFFTTKPTGSGTGLGLSLSYDIVKAHGGELRVSSKEGKGTEFIIKTPFH
ncbi:hypothetical protein Aoki45_21430 [Algoriphagus sp. oki45]|uniref:ATP-binding protein n=1 Tax=Algoriphagus sp. oki45 TaxID=3067294 RepID=UPI0027FE67C6|nr:hypothetical protein Aoki45_21430 [Algoriphagus sp. oki45]